jgi:hypothetical protein
LDFDDVRTRVPTVAILSALLGTLYFSQRRVRALKVDRESRVLNDISDTFRGMAELFLARPELIRRIHRTPGDQNSETPAAYSVMTFCAHIFPMRERGILGDNEWAGGYHRMPNAFRWGTIIQVWTDEQMGLGFDPAFRDFVDRELAPLANVPSPSAPAARAA